MKTIGGIGGPSPVIAQIFSRCGAFSFPKDCKLNNSWSFSVCSSTEHFFFIVFCRREVEIALRIDFPNQINRTNDRNWEKLNQKILETN